MSKLILVQVRLPEDEGRALDDYRRSQPDLPSRPDALRQLARAGGLRRQESSPISSSLEHHRRA
jgi:hypothetical protein